MTRSSTSRTRTSSPKDASIRGSWEVESWPCPGTASKSKELRKRHPQVVRGFCMRLEVGVSSQGIANFGKSEASWLVSASDAC